MFNSVVLFELFALLTYVCANYNGPFVFWGRKKLSNIKVASLHDLDEKYLQRIYADSPAIVVFVRNASNRLNEENFPTFKTLLQQTEHLYLPQYQLASDPIDYNLNAEVINLVGPASQQDVELSALYRDAILANGAGNVLGILATKTSDHEMRKRTADEDPNFSTTTTSMPIGLLEPNLPEEERKENFIFYSGEQSYKILLHTQSPQLIINGSNSMVVLDDSKITITTNQRNQNTKTLNVRYNSKGQLSLEYIFNISGVYWTLVGVDINGNNTLYVLGQKPSAPFGFSYKCAKPLLFKNESTYLELANIHVKPNVKSKRFDEAYDCVDFTTAPIWSGIFISAIICFVVAIGLNCIMEMKPPNRFENSRGKQLTFTISE